jgi:hypothetical protein
LDLFAGHLAVLPLFRGLSPLQIAAIARCAERVVYLEKTVKAWGLWSELSGDRDLTAIQVVSGDHRAMQMDSD